MSHKYWEESDYQELEIADSYRELSPIALRILERMSGPIVQVCGPISTGGAGSIEENLKRFEAAIENLSKSGLEVFSQVPFEVPMQKIKARREEEGYDMDLLNHFYLPIFESGHVDQFYFLPDWQTSFGSKWEHGQAERLGIEIVYLD